MVVFNNKNSPKMAIYFNNSNNNRRRFFNFNVRLHYFLCGTYLLYDSSSTEEAAEEAG